MRITDAGGAVWGEIGGATVRAAEFVCLISNCNYL
jgi:hypothetical protein